MRRWLLTLVFICLLTLPGFAAGDPDWRAASGHAKANSTMLVFVVAKDDGTVVREAAYCGSTIWMAGEVLSAWHCVDSEARVEGTWAYTMNGQKFKVEGILRKNIGFDLVLLKVPGIKPAGVVVLSEDIATGDEVMGIGAPFGEKFKASWGRIDRIYTGLHDVCDGVRRPEPIGHKDHQIVETDRVSFFGYSGGGVWNRQGELVGVHVRGAYWEPYPGYSCTEGYKGEYLVWGAAVGPTTVKQFLTKP